MNRRIGIVGSGLHVAGALLKALNAEGGKTHRVALCVELPQDGSLPDWIELIPAGQVITGRDGRTWINDRPESVVAYFQGDGKDTPIDWEHSTEIKAPEGECAPAAGWISEMEAREGGAIWGKVEWTPRGAESIKNREYRYLSPVFIYEIESRRIIGITSVGLTNRPNLFINALNREGLQEENHMLKKLLVVLGLPEATTEEAALNHITTLRGDLATARNQAQNPPLDKFVPAADHQLALNRATTAETALKAIKDAQLETAINTEIDAALKAGKITPATKEYHVAQCKQEGGLDRFKAFCSAAPVVGTDTGLDGKEVETGRALNAEEKKVCENLGISEEEYRKANP